MLTRRVLIRSARYPNPTTRTGAVVHAPTRSGYPKCGLYMHGIVYTFEAPNCPRCERVE